MTLPKGASYSLYFDAGTGLKVRYAKVIETPQGAITSAIDFLDYQLVDGIMIPYVTVQKAGPQKLESRVNEALLNQQLDAGTFIIE